MTEWESQSERPGGQREREREKEKKRRRDRRRRDEKVLAERITLPSGTDRVGGEVDLCLRVSLVFSLHSPEWWDCRKAWSSEDPRQMQTERLIETHTHTQSLCAIVSFAFVLHTSPVVSSFLSLTFSFFFSLLSNTNPERCLHHFQTPCTVYILLKIAADSESEENCLPFYSFSMTQHVDACFFFSSPSTKTRHPSVF